MDIDDAVYHMPYGKKEIDNMTDEQKKTKMFIKHWGHIFLETERRPELAERQK